MVLYYGHYEVKILLLFFKKFSSKTESHKEARKAIHFIVYLFCGSHISHFSEILLTFLLKQIDMRKKI